MKAVTEMFGFSLPAPVMERAKEARMQGSILTTEATLYSILLDRALPAEARDQKLTRQSKKIREFAELYQVDFKRLVQKSLMVKTMEKILSEASGQKPS